MPLLIGILAIGVVSLIACGFMIYRNNQVYRFRIMLVDNNMDIYHTLPDYDTMLNKFWIPLIDFVQPEDRPLVRAFMISERATKRIKIPF